MKECYIIDENEISKEAKEIENRLLEENKVLMIINKIGSIDVVEEKEADT